MKSRRRGVRNTQERQVVKRADAPPLELKESNLAYVDVLSRACSLRRWCVIVHRAVTEAERGDAKARDWLSHYVLGKPDKIAMEVSAGHVLTLLRDVVTTLGHVAERSITSDEDRRAFQREGQKALAALLPQAFVKESAFEAKSEVPEFITRMVQDLGPDITDEVFKGFMSYLASLVRGQGRELPASLEAQFRESLEAELREPIDALTTACQEEEADREGSSTS